MEQAASQASTFISPRPLLAQKSPSSLDHAGGAREAAGVGVIGLEGGELHHNGTHWRSPLIRRKDRIPNRNVRTIRRLGVASLVGRLGEQLAPDAEPGPT